MPKRLGLVKERKKFSLKDREGQRRAARRYWRLKVNVLTTRYRRASIKYLFTNFRTEKEKALALQYYNLVGRQLDEAEARLDALNAVRR